MNELLILVMEVTASYPGECQQRDGASIHRRPGAERQGRHKGWKYIIGEGETSTGTVRV